MKYSIYALAIGFIAAGCSPYIYSAEIEDFAKASDSLSGAISSATQEIADAPAELAYWRSFADPKVRASYVDEACVASAQNCHIEINRVSTAPSDTERELITRLATLGRLSSYAKALEAITDAGDRAEFDAATARARSAAVNLAAVVTGPLLPGVDAALQIGSRAVGVAFDQSRFNQLKDTVRTVDPVLKAAVPALGDAFAELRAFQIDTLKERMEAVQGVFASDRPLGRAERDALIGQLRSDAHAIATLQRADPKAAIESFARAHEALNLALQTQTVEPEELFSEIATFLELAKAVEAGFAAPRS